MMFFYVDESGTGLRDKGSPYFLLAAVGIHAADWGKVDKSFYRLKKGLISWAQPEDFEIKGRDLRRGAKIFSGLDWQARVEIIHKVAELISEIPCVIFAVQVAKQELPDFIASEDQLYRIAFVRLLDALDHELDSHDQRGLVMLDQRSDLHTSIQDRRVIDAYRTWLAERQKQTKLVELPWFGFSAFYGGLQLADFAAYLIDFVSNESHPSRHSELVGAYARFKDRVNLLRLP